MNKKLVWATAAAAAVSIAFAAPSVAATYPLADVEIGSQPGNYWSFETTGNLSFYGPWNTMWSNSGDAETWDDSGAELYGSDHSTYATIQCDDPADLSDASDASGDKVLTCDPQLIDNGDGELSVVTELRFYADGQTLRERFIITNDGTEPVDPQVLWVNFNAYQDNMTFVNWVDGSQVGSWDPAEWSESDYTTDEHDYVWVTDDREEEQSSPVVKYAVGREGSAVSLLNNYGFNSGGQGDGDDSNSSFELPAIAAGDTVEIVVLTKVYLFDEEASLATGDLSQWETNTYNTVLLAQADTALESNAVVYAGISDTSRVLNWKPLDEEQSLPNTGFDAAPLGTIALFALAGGVALIVRRRAVK